MNKNNIVIILSIIVVALAGVIIWQFKNSNTKDNIIVNSPAKVLKNTNIDEPVKEKAVVKNPEVFPKVTVPPKDQEALSSKFTYDVPVSKIIDKKWMWIEAINYDDTTFVPIKSGAFSLTFKKDGTFSGTTDCNGISGKYTTKNGTIKFSSISQTMMYCEGAEEIKFTTYLNQVRGFQFNGEENLVLNFEFDSGSMIFK